MKTFTRGMALFVLAGIFFVPVGVMGQDQEPGLEQEIRQLLNEGIDLYWKGKGAEAVVKLELGLNKVTAASKDDADKVRLAGLLYAFVDRIGMDNLLKGVNDTTQPETLRNSLQRILELAKPGMPSRPSADELKTYLAYMKSQDTYEYQSGLFHLVHYGAYAVKPLIKELANDQDKTYRVRVMDLFHRIGTEATLALAEAIKSKNDLMRQNAAITLGLIKDDRALPALKRMVENPNEKPEVKKHAIDAIQVITTKRLSELPSAKELYYNLAEKYFYGHPSVLSPLYQAYLVWSWDVVADELVEREARRFAYNEQLAEEACLNAIEIDPDYEQAWSLLVNVVYAQDIEANLAITALEKSVREELEPRATLDQLKKEFEEINRMNVLGNMSGRKYLYLGLKRALDDDEGYGNFPVARSILGAIQTMGRTDELPLDPRKLPQGARTDQFIGYPLIHALSHHGDKRIRYTAAETMVRLNPQEWKLGMELVIPTLIDALGEEGVRIALVIHENKTPQDQDSLNKLKRTLSRFDIVTEFAHTAGQGLTKARMFPNKDIVLMQSKFHNELVFMEDITRRGTYETVMDAMLKDARLKYTPLFLMCETDPERDAVFAIYRDTPMVREFQVIAKPIQELKLKDLLDKTFNTEEAKKDSADKAIDIARISAETLASIDPNNTLYPYRDAIPPLIKKMDPTTIVSPDRVRIPCARALGRFGDVRALDILTKVFDDEANSDDLRRTCVQSISNILRLNEVRPPDPILTVLKKRLFEGKGDPQNQAKYQIELAVGEALGNAKLTNAERAELERAKQLKRAPSASQ